MKLVEVANKYLPRRTFECWYLRRIEMIEPEEVARRMGISVAVVYNYVFLATRELAEHADEIEDPDDYLAYMLSILRGHRVENAVDSTAKAVIKRQERSFSVKSVDKQ